MDAEYDDCLGKLSVLSVPLWFKLHWETERRKKSRHSIGKVRATRKP